MHRFRLVLLLLCVWVFLFMIAGTGTGGETNAAGPSVKYGDGQYVAYAFNEDYTAYGLGRGTSKEEAVQRAKENCSGTGCGDGETGVYMPGCFAMFRMPDGTYKDISRFSMLSEDMAWRIGKSKFGEDCQLEIILCSN